MTSAQEGQRLAAAVGNQRASEWFVAAVGQVIPPDFAEVTGEVVSFQAAEVMENMENIRSND